MIIKRLKRLFYFSEAKFGFADFGPCVEYNILVINKLGIVVLSGSADFFGALFVLKDVNV